MANQKKSKSVFLFICNKKDQCSTPCNAECNYTTDWFKSKLYQSLIKPGGTIKFLQDKYGNFFELDPNKPGMIPSSVPPTTNVFETTYQELNNYAIRSQVMKGMKENANKANSKQSGFVIKGSFT